MKKFTAVIIAILVICCLMSISAVAETPVAATVQTPGIASASLSFNGSVHMYFNVYFGETDPATDYGVIFWTAQQADGDYTYANATAEGAPATIVAGTDANSTIYREHHCKEFVYSVAAKGMTDMIYVQGYVKDGDSYVYSTVLPYSVQTYAGRKLGIYPNVAEANISTNEDFINMVKALLEFGSYSQTYFKYRTDDLADTILHWSKGLEYTANADGTCYVSGRGTCTATDIYIPKMALDGECKGKTVTGIGDSALKECFNIESITIPNTVTSIGKEAFDNDSCLQKVVIPNSVTAIGNSAFKGCISLESIAIPEGVERIEYWTFNMCSALTSATIPQSVTYIGRFAFANCELKDITFNGTKAQWSDIDKVVTEGNEWDFHVTGYTVHCTDGDIAK